MVYFVITPNGIRYELIFKRLKKMELKEAIQVLKDHNVWRRCEDENAIMTDPKKLGVAIDTVVSEFENLFISGVVKSLKDKKEMSFGIWKMKCKDIEYIDRKLLKYKGHLMSYEDLEKEYYKIKHTL